MPRLPPVEKLPHTRLRFTLSPGVGYSVVTFDQSHSSSSATSWASPVIVPWPISERAMRMTTVSSGLITTQALISGVAPGRARPAAANGMSRPSASPPPAVAAPTTKAAAIDFRNVVHGRLPLHALAAAWIAVAHLLEGAAATDVGDGRVDVGVGGFGLLLEQRRHRHDHAGLAIAALWHVVIDPGLLHLVQGAALSEAPR